MDGRTEFSGLPLLWAAAKNKTKPNKKKNKTKQNKKQTNNENTIFCHNQMFFGRQIGGKEDSQTVKQRQTVDHIGNDSPTHCHVRPTVRPERQTDPLKLNEPWKGT